MYNPKGSACPATCHDPWASEECEELQVETCECPEGQVLDDEGTCVDLVSCCNSHQL